MDSLWGHLQVSFDREPTYKLRILFLNYRSVQPRQLEIKWLKIFPNVLTRACLKEKEKNFCNKIFQISKSDRYRLEWLSLNVKNSKQLVHVPFASFWLSLIKGYCNC